MQYKATIEFTAYKDDYTEGEQVQPDNWWKETLTADTKDDLREKIADATYQPTFAPAYFDYEQINGYDHATEYNTSYLANGQNDGNASGNELEQWKKGKLDLWAIHCHVLVTQVEETKAEL